MAKAYKKAIEAGREAREIGLAEKLVTAAATSPLTGFLSPNLRSRAVEQEVLDQLDKP